MPWRVTLTGADTGAEYVIRVDAPADAFEPAVYQAAAFAYNEEREVGRITERFRPPMSAEYTDDKEGHDRDHG